jgi:NAD(P)-dependent dehydrogenase (short-subunit alcohol dehydrogenase family)
MTLELGGRKIVVTGGKRELARANAEPVSNEGADVVIWVRDWTGDVDKLKQLLARIEAQVAPQPPNGTSPHTSLWRETMRAQKCYW